MSIAIELQGTGKHIPFIKRKCEEARRADANSGLISNEWDLLAVLVECNEGVDKKIVRLGEKDFVLVRIWGDGNQEYPQEKKHFISIPDRLVNDLFQQGLLEERVGCGTPVFVPTEGGMKTLVQHIGLEEMCETNIKRMEEEVGKLRKAVQGHIYDPRSLVGDAILVIEALLKTLRENLGMEPR